MRPTGERPHRSAAHSARTHRMRPTGERTHRSAAHSARAHRMRPTGERTHRMRPTYKGACNAHKTGACNAHKTGKKVCGTLTNTTQYVTYNETK